jgi:hypothetical protein
VCRRACSQKQQHSETPTSLMFRRMTISRRLSRPANGREVAGQVCRPTPFRCKVIQSWLLAVVRSDISSWEVCTRKGHDTEKGTSLCQGLTRMRSGSRKRRLPRYGAFLLISLAALAHAFLQEQMLQRWPYLLRHTKATLAILIAKNACMGSFVHQN